MSWRFLQGQEVGSWEGSSLGGAPDALLKLTPTHKASCSIDSETDCCHISQSGTTFALSTENHGEEPSTSSAEVFHAKTLAQPVKALESPGNKADYGVTWQELLVKYDLNTCSWKTRQCLFGEDCTPYSVILPRWGTMRHGACWGLEMLEPHTNATDCGYWPTPSGTSSHGKNHVVGRLDEWGGSSNRFRGTSLQRVRCPEFEEWMMGWPEGWSNAQTAFGMDKFQQWLNSHGKH
mgnify:CR=1 FL=1